MRKCMVIGSFDPVTAGHIELIRRAAAIFERTYAVVMRNEKKSCFFTEEERLCMLEAACRGIPGVCADMHTGLAVDYAKKMGISFIVRGIRNPDDLVYEMELAGIYRGLDPDIETVFLPAYGETADISSTRVRELLAAGEDPGALVPHEILELMIRYTESKRTLE